MVTVSVFCTSGVDGVTVTVPKGSVRDDSVRNRRGAAVVPDAEAFQGMRGTGGVAAEGTVELLIDLTEIKKWIIRDRIFVIFHLLDGAAVCERSTVTTIDSERKKISRSISEFY